VNTLNEASTAIFRDCHNVSRPANTEKSLSESFSRQSRGGHSKARSAAARGPKVKAGMGFLGRSSSPLPLARGSMIFHCFGH